MDELHAVIAEVLGTSSGATMRTRGIAPAQQARSRATFVALIQAGLKIAERKDFFNSTVDEVATSAKASVGAFYERFQSKETFFSALQEIVAARVERAVRSRVAAPDFARLDYGGAVDAIVDTWLSGIRRHRGLIRASLRHIPVRDDAWFPLRKLAGRMAEIYVEELGPRIARQHRGDLQDKVRVALQFVNGIVVNIILNDPGPLRLDDERLDGRIRQVIDLFVNDERPANQRISQESKRAAI